MGTSPQYLAEIWERSFCFGSAGQFPPSDQLDFLPIQNFPELVAREKIEVALPPGRAPCRAFSGGGAQFVIVITGMDDELCHTRFQVLQRSEVKFRPFFRWNSRFNGNRMSSTISLGPRLACKYG